MNYAANTGKESQFLEKCISSGKYRTLILRSNCTDGSREVIAAVSFQIIPSDTQYAEIPLAAVSANYQNKGIGHLLCEELKARLQGVGILTILCWADKESEGFWLKKGFISIGEVDSKDKARRLPIKADIRRALCFPGGSTLMVAHLKRDDVASVDFTSKSNAKPYNCFPTVSAGHAAISRTDTSVSLSEHATGSVFHQTKTAQSQQLLKEDCSSDSPHGNGHSPAPISLPCHRSSSPCMDAQCNCTGVNLEVPENGCKTDGIVPSGPKVKRRVWEASLSSLKSKRVRGSHHIDGCQDIGQDLASVQVRGLNAFDDCSLGNSGHKSLVEVLRDDPVDVNSWRAHTASKLDNVVPESNGPRIMFMNIADDAKKECLTKIVKELGGSVTCDGSASTHVMTGKARRTMNFCIALCSGAWILSPHWLKESCREGRFLGESQFILQDEDYLLKYKSELRDAVIRARSNPKSLLKGYNFCISKYIQPSVNILSAIIKSAGGSVIPTLDGIQDPSSTIFLACEEDMEDTVVATNKGILTYSGDWFMTCVMKQELNLEAPQFAESL
ncbi:uncharacterized protein M6B38_149805 [Iris pallida]|uniref:Uncharacterized protein n=1 Tax=Iris pallida TaxID=29817 RepID=A0AAX6F7I8_IRIPA|nr:uncharacterized protein M6B38_149805 [Iris pallida]